MNSKNSKTSDPHRLLLYLADKINLRKAINMLLYQTLAFIINGKIKKSHTKIINLKYEVRHGQEFELPDGSYSLSDIQDYFKYISSNIDKRLITFQYVIRK